MVATPSTEYKITTIIDFNSTVLGTQHAYLKSLKSCVTKAGRLAHGGGQGNEGIHTIRLTDEAAWLAEMGTRPKLPRS